MSPKRLQVVSFAAEATCRPNYLLKAEMASLFPKLEALALKRTAGSDSRRLSNLHVPTLRQPVEKEFVTEFKNRILWFSSVS